MKLETVEEKEDVLKLKIDGINEVTANSLRRAMMTKVPTLAVKELQIVKNESALFDEVLANRVGQVPFTIPENVDGDDTVHIALKQEGPGEVLAEDLKTDNEGADPVNPEAIIVSLKETQGIDFEAEAELDRGEEHAKHQGGTVGYEKVDDESYIFRIESTSGYGNKELLEKAVEQTMKDLNEFENAVEEL